MPISLIILLMVFILIAIRQWLPPWVAMWQIMLAGALMMLLTHQVMPMDIFKLVHWNIIGFLFGVFSIGVGLQKTGILIDSCEYLLSKFQSLNAILFVFMIFMALGAAFFTNDTMAVIGTPVALLLGQQTRTSPKLFLLALCFSLTIGSALTPIGNPQNMLIGLRGHLEHPFSLFFIYTSVPVVLSMILCFFWLRGLFWRKFCQQQIHQLSFVHHGEVLSRLPTILSIILFIILLIYHGFDRMISILPPLSIAWVSIVASLPMYMFSRKRWTILRHNDWRTLVFFIAMFIVVGTVWHSGVVQHFINQYQINLRDPLHIFIISTIGSQIISNVPLVELYLSYLGHSSSHLLMALSLSSTLAGNLFIISAASTVIVIQQAERLGNRSIMFWNFCLAGFPLTIATLALSYIWVMLL